MDTFNLARMDAEDERHRSSSESGDVAADFAESGFAVEDAPEDAGTEVGIEYDGDDDEDEDEDFGDGLNDDFGDDGE